MRNLEIGRAEQAETAARAKGREIRARTAATVELLLMAAGRTLFNSPTYP